MIFYIDFVFRQGVKSPADRGSKSATHPQNPCSLEQGFCFLWHKLAKACFFREKVIQYPKDFGRKAGEYYAVYNANIYIRIFSRLHGLILFGGAFGEDPTAEKVQTDRFGPHWHQLRLLYVGLHG